MAKVMRGLNLFIADMRSARVPEAEEKIINKEMLNIRVKFKDPRMDGYHRKKYVAKIVFCYIMGYRQDLGQMEAITLITSPKYSEKQIGYLGVTLMLHENHPLLNMVVNTIKKDLEDNWEIHNCLALQAIANICGQSMAEALVADVHRLMVSPTSNNFVKKKAALTLLRIHRKHPDVVPAVEWAPRIISLMDDADLGVVVSITSLVMALAQDYPDAYATSYQKAVDRLHKLAVGKQYSEKYEYYKVPSPWLQVKLLRLLQYYPPAEDQAIRSMTTKVLRAILESASETPRNVQHANAVHAVLFEAINAAIHLDPDSSLTSTSSVLLARFILSKETNVRYLGLDAMAHLAGRAETLDPIKKHQNTIITSLRDKDISVRRRALDLLYSMCDVDNAQIIVGELLSYLKIADYGLREEMVLKIAICCEKFATEYKWYVDTILELISAAGDYVSDEVWYRVIQIVTNTEDLQPYTAHTVFNHLKSPSCHESLIKVAGYILGEYGHLIANEPGCSPYEQFQALHAKSNFCSATTRALILTTYIKWVNIFPEIKRELVSVFDRYRHVLDAELQQRACEYLALASRPDDDELIQTVWDEMPPFPERESSLLNRLAKKHGDTGDKRTWVVGGREANRDREAMRLKSLQRIAAQATAAGAGSPPSSPTATGRTRPSVRMPVVLTPGAGVSDIMSSLAGLDLSSPMSPGGAGSMEPTVLRTPDVDEKYVALLKSSTGGVLYDDVQLQIGLKTDYKLSQGALAVYFGNRLSSPMRSFTVTVKTPQPELLGVDIQQMPESTIEPQTQNILLLTVNCKAAFTEPPTIHISFLTGALTTLSLRLPVALHKFFEPVLLEPQDFYLRWQKIGGPPREVQVFFPIKLKNGEVDTADQTAKLKEHRIQILDGVDPNKMNLIGAGVLYTSKTAKAGFLIRVEPSQQEKKCRLTVRCTSDIIGPVIMDYVRKLLKA